MQNKGRITIQLRQGPIALHISLNNGEGHILTLGSKWTKNISSTWTLHT